MPLLPDIVEQKFAQANIYKTIRNKCFKSLQLLPTFPIYVLVHAQHYMLLAQALLVKSTIKLHMKPYTYVCTYHELSPVIVRIASKLWLMILPSNVGFCKDVNEISASMMGPSVMKVRQDGPYCAGSDG